MCMTLKIVVFAAVLAALVLAAGCKCPCKGTTSCPVPQKVASANAAFQAADPQ